MLFQYSFNITTTSKFVQNSFNIMYTHNLLTQKISNFWQISNPTKNINVIHLDFKNDHFPWGRKHYFPKQNYSPLTCVESTIRIVKAKHCCPHLDVFYVHSSSFSRTKNTHAQTHIITCGWMWKKFETIIFIKYLYSHLWIWKNKK